MLLTENVNGKESLAIHDYLNGGQSGVTLEDIPESLRPLAVAIKEQATDDVVLSATRYSNAKHTDVMQRESAEASANDDARDMLHVLNGTGKNTEKTRLGLDKINNVPDVPHFFLTKEGFELIQAGGERSLGRQYVVAGFVGENLRRTAEAIAEGTGFFNEQAIDNFFVMYDSLRNTANSMGVTVTPWDRSLSAEQVATLDTINYAIKNLRGNQNAAEVYTRIQEFMADEDQMKRRMRAVTGSLTGESFVADTVGEENVVAIDYFVPLMPYYVAGNLSKEDIATLMRDTMERQFPSTEGYIVDPVGGNGIFKSQHSLTKYFGSKGDRIAVVQNLNRLMVDKGINAYIPRIETTLIEKGAFALDTLFGGVGSVENMNILDMADLGIREDATAVFLMPIKGMGTGETDEGNIVYQLVTMTQSEAGADIGFDMYKHNGLPVYFTVEQMRASLQTTDTTEWYDVPNPFGVSP